MTFLDRVLDPPSYGYERDGKLYVPTQGEIAREFFSRLNVLRSKKNWLGLFSWATSLSFALPLGIFLIYYRSPGLMLAGFLYGMILTASHATFWLHRYGTHRAFKFRAPWAAQICRNLVLKIIPEEVYIISHYVHHQYSELPKDPYNPHAGWLYCFLADVNHQGIAKNLNERDYQHLCRLMEHTGVKLNTYAQYQRWGSLCHPFYTVLHWTLNWGFWYGVFYFVGGHALATALFGWSGVWAIGVRTFNYDGHGRGANKKREGIDFYQADNSINQTWPGWAAGEWHNNHHLYPNGARSGFMPQQVDLPWYFIRFLSAVGMVSSYRDFQEDFNRDHYLPWLRTHGKEAEASRLAGST